MAKKEIPKHWKQALHTIKSLADLPEDMRQELVRRIAKHRDVVDRSNLLEVIMCELSWRMIVEEERPTEIANKAGIHLSQLTRFLGRERAVSLANASKLARALDLVLVPRPKPKPKPKPKGKGVK